MAERALPVVILFSHDSAWKVTVGQALHGLASVHRVVDEPALSAWMSNRQASVRLVLVDAAGFSDRTALLEFVQKWKPRVPLAVAASVPSWRDARDLLLLGVYDYIRKTEVVDDLRDQLVRLVRFTRA